jgi:hypothetical protein
LTRSRDLAHPEPVSTLADHRADEPAARPVEDEDLRWWAEQARPCPRCGGPGRPVVLEVTDVSTQTALREGLACLGDCCIDGTGGQHVCSRCGLGF